MAWERGSCATTNKGAEESPVDSLSDEDLEDQVECTQQPDPAGEMIVKGLNLVQINADGALMIAEDTFFVRFPIPNVQGIGRGPGMNKNALPEDPARGSHRADDVNHAPGEDCGPRFPADEDRYERALLHGVCDSPCRCGILSHIRRSRAPLFWSMLCSARAHAPPSLTSCIVRGILSRR